MSADTSTHWNHDFLRTGLYKNNIFFNQSQKLDIWMMTISFSSFFKIFFSFQDFHSCSALIWKIRSISLSNLNRNYFDMEYQYVFELWRPIPFRYPSFQHILFHSFWISFERTVTLLPCIQSVFSKNGHNFPFCVLKRDLFGSLIFINLRKT